MSQDFQYHVEPYRCHSEASRRAWPVLYGVGVLLNQSGEIPRRTSERQGWTWGLCGDALSFSALIFFG